MSEGHQIICSERMTIEKVESFYTELESALSQYTEIELMAEGVQQCDTASLQLIANFIDAAKQQGHLVTWVKPSESIINVAELLGLLEPLELTQHITQ